jgi:hypothetical protein
MKTPAGILCGALVAGVMLLPGTLAAQNAAFVNMNNILEDSP